MRNLKLSHFNSPSRDEHTPTCKNSNERWNFWDGDFLRPRSLAFVKSFHSTWTFNQMLTNWNGIMNYVTHKAFWFEIFCRMKEFYREISPCAYALRESSKDLSTSVAVDQWNGERKCLGTKRKSHFSSTQIWFLFGFPSVRSSFLSSFILKGKINFLFSFFSPLRSCWCCRFDRFEST